MIKSFRSKALRQFAQKGDASKLPVAGAAIGRITRQLKALDVASAPGQMDVPGWYFHPLKALARYTVRVTANYRITFGFEGEDATEVDLEDYH